MWIASEDQTETGSPQSFMSHRHHTKHRGSLTMASLSYGPAEGLQPHLNGCRAAQTRWYFFTAHHLDLGGKCQQAHPNRASQLVPQLLPQPGHSRAFHPTPTFTEPSMDHWWWVHWLGCEGQVTQCLGIFVLGKVFFPGFLSLFLPN